jgi:hypothetical protein
LLEESLALSREAADAFGSVRTLINLALVAMTSDDDVGADELLKESLRVARESRDNAGAASSLHLLGLIDYRHDRLAESRALLEEGLVLRRSEADSWGTAQALCDLGLVLHAQGLSSAARAHHAEAIGIWRELADVWGLAYALEGVAVLFGATNPERTVQLVASATAARERLGIRPLPGRQADLQRILRACAEALGPERYKAAWSTGRAIDLQSAIDEAFKEIVTDQRMPGDQP